MRALKTSAVLAAGAVLGLGACGVAPDANVSLNGSGETVTDAFTLSTGYYAISRQVTSQAQENCYFYAQIEAPDGQVPVAIQGPLVTGIGTATFTSDDYVVDTGQYVLRTYSGCGDWLVRIVHQTVFDEQSKAQAEGRQPRLYPPFADPQYLRDMPPPVETVVASPTSEVAAAVATPTAEPRIVGLRVANTSPIGFVNVRSGPSTSSARQGSLPEGSLVAADGPAQSGWLHVRGRNFQGYITTQFLSQPLTVPASELAALGPIIDPTPTVQATPSLGAALLRVASSDGLGALNVHTGASLAAVRSGSIPEGSVIALVRRVNANWVEVRGQDFQGFVMAQYLASTTAPPDAKLASLQKLPPAAAPGPAIRRP